MDGKTVDALKAAISRKWKRKGNGLYAGKFMDNTVYKGIQYIKHDPNVEWSHRGPYWRNIIDASPEWEDRVEKKARVEKEKLGHPVLTYSNVLKQAMLHREKYNLVTTELGAVLEHMTEHTNWTPDIRIMRTGLDEMHFRLFRYRCEGRLGPAPAWWKPKAEAHF